MKSNFLILLTLTVSFLLGCGSADAPPEPIPTAAPAATLPATAEPIAPTLAPTNTPEQVDPTIEAVTVIEETEPEEQFPPTSTPIPATVEPEPAAELSPAEQLIASFIDPIQIDGEALILVGQVLDTTGNPIPDSVVEIWQTDTTGVYDHPQDPGTSSRDIAFQFYGSAPADGDGWYAFRTILPGQYEPRPRHIHFKVKQNGATLLTSQFYFSDDIAKVTEEGMFRAIGDSGDLLLLQLVQAEESLLANGQIVIDTGNGSGDLPITPSQQEGPFYPVVPVSEFDNDLAIK